MGDAGNSFGYGGARINLARWYTLSNPGFARG